MLMRTDPFRELDRLTQQVFGTSSRPAAMPIDAFQQGDEFVVQFDVPGVTPDTIKLPSSGTSSRSTRQRNRWTGDDVELLISQRPHGTFSRQLFLAETLDTERLGAVYADGVLTLRLPVREQAKPRRVNIACRAVRANLDRCHRLRRRAPSRRLEQLR